MIKSSSMIVAAIIALSLVGVLADYFLKLSGNGTKYIDIKFFLVGMIIYALLAIGWFLVMKHAKLGSIGMIYSVVTTISLAIMGYLFFKESLNIYEMIGMITGVISIVLLARFA